ncbi:hypothetical protein WJX81_002227 [Elliptochloris bilobata]|uniref:Uncharacterized protein n=1 Tax=Elliptochloris bilobata TaxID=381761 RepID=A0AAW1RUM3_9CHLO
MKCSAPQAGHFLGTLSGAIPYVPHGEHRLRKGEHVKQPRGVYTTPMKRGGYGYNKTTLSEIHGHKGVVRCCGIVPTSVHYKTAADF